MKALIVIACLGVIAMMSEVLRFRKLLLPLVALGLLTCVGLNVVDWNTNESWFPEMIQFDHFALAFGSLIAILTLFWMMISNDYFKSNTSWAEHASLVLFSLFGAYVMVSYADLSMLFIGIEILSISLYILAASDKMNLKSNEAGLKYFLMGSFATGFLLFGIALIYGATGSFNLVKIGLYLHTSGTAMPGFVYAGVLLMMVGLLFKVSAVPFHFWAPDVYEGAPTLVTSYMATVVKVAAFAAFYRLFATCFSDLTGMWGQTLAVISGVTMLGGNILAVYQKSFKRMLAYSGVANAGYMLMAIVSMNQLSAGAIFFYASVYSIGTMGAFACLHAISGADGDERIDNLKGLSSSKPGITLFMCIIMLSLAGIPPVAGFFAKYYLFLAALNGAHGLLVLTAILSSLIGVYYYFRVVYTMFQSRPENAPEHEFNFGHYSLIVIAAVIVLALGVFPGLIQGLL